MSFPADIRTLWVAVTATFAAAAVMQGCGGSGGGEDPIIRESTFLAEYRYELRQDADSEARLVLGTQWGGSAYEFSIRYSGPAGVTGLYQRTGGVASIATGSEISVDTDLATPLIGAFRAAVDSGITTTPTGEFSAGAWTIATDTDTVGVRVDGGVSLSLNGGPATLFDWAAFSALFGPGSSAPAWQQAASASFLFLRLALLQANVAFTALVDATDVSFTNTPGTRNCSMFPVAPPAGVLAQGERVLAWLGSADLGFELRFTDCWIDAGGDAQDYLYHGDINLSGWRASSDRSNRLIFLGFGGDEFGSRVPGGVRYADLSLARTLPASEGHVLDTAASYTLSGGYAVAFTAP